MHPDAMGPAHLLCGFGFFLEIFSSRPFAVRQQNATNASDTGLARSALAAFTLRATKGSLSACSILPNLPEC